jgi:elongation factor G
VSEKNPGETRKSGPKCIALVGPFASGKTSLLEELLFRCGAIDKAGSVDAKSSLGDAAPEARDHGMSVEVNVADADFMGDHYTFVDCPGSVEFGYESLPVLAGVDAAIVVVEPDEKKIPALQVTLRELEERQIPHFLFLNKIDKASMGVRDALAMLQPASSVPLVLRQLPIWNDGIATGFIDLALDRAFVYEEHAASKLVDLTGDDAARRDEARYTMLETLADHDDRLMEQLLEDIDPPQDEVFGDLVRELREGLIVPVFIGSALNGNGILRLLKALRHETAGVEETRARLGLEDEGDPVVQVLKTVHTSHGGKLSLARVLRGKLDDGAELARNDGESARTSGLYRLFGQKASKGGAVEAGETVALGKLEFAKTGDTLTLRGGSAPVIEIPAPPQPVLQKVIMPSERKDEVKLSAALHRMVEEDPSLVVTHRQETGETLIGGQGEMHLRVAVERLIGKAGLSVETRTATVPYRETIRAAVTARGRHKKQSGGHGQFGDVVLNIEPLPRGTGFVFNESISGGVVPRQYFSAVEAGVREALAAGPLGGFPVVDVGVTLVDGSHHSVDSSEQAFKMAGILGIREGLPDARPVLLEPVLSATIAVPSEMTAKVNAIVSSRRGQLMGYDSRPGWTGWDEVKALIPESEITDLIIELRSATAGVGTFTSEFDHLAEVNGKMAEDILREVGREAA